MVNVAIAGTNGFAQFIANFIATQTSHQFIILSRHPKPAMTAKGWQVLQVDYANASDLRYKLYGVDSVISTIRGNDQLYLIDAAAASHIKRFVPSEFEGTPSSRPPNDVFDDARRAALARLQLHESSGMRFTVITCGLFYERFGPGGMGAFQIGLSTDISGEGEYIMDIRHARAQIPYYDSNGHPVYICMTAASDVARFVVAALDLPSWPREMRIYGDRMTVSNLVAIGEQMRGQPFERSNYTRDSLQDALTYALAIRDVPRQNRIQHLIATAESRYSFDNAINSMQMVGVPLQCFREWLFHAWADDL